MHKSQHIFGPVENNRFLLIAQLCNSLARTRKTEDGDENFDQRFGTVAVLTHNDERTGFDTETPLKLIEPLDPSEPRAPTNILSKAKRSALITCLRAGSLHKERGAWIPLCATAGNERISGITVADLRRHGMMTLTALGRHASARLMARGIWFARTALMVGLRPPSG